MKRIFLMLGLSILTFSHAQDKELTLSDAVLKGYRELAPESKLDLKIIPETQNYVYLSSDYQQLISGGIKSKQAEKPIATTSDINSQVPEAQLRHLYGAQWLNNTTFQIFQNNRLIRYNIKDKKAELVSSLLEGTSGHDINTDGMVAALMENNLLISNNSENLIVADNDDKNIVSGQAIARSEFGITKGTFWSPKNNALAFYQKDESAVADYPLLNIMPTPGELNSIKYPMAGQPSEKAKVGIYHMASKKVVFLQSPVEEEEHYFTNLGWSPDEMYVTIAELNRDQNHMWFNVYNALTGEFVRTLFEEQHERYVEPEHPAHFIDNSKFIWLSERDGQTQAYLYDLKDGLKKKISKQEWEITGILDHDKSYLYVTGTGEDPTEMHAFKVSLKGGKMVALTKASGYHSVNLDVKSGMLIDKYSSVSVPGVTQFIDKNGRVVKKMLVAANPLEDYKISMPELGTITSPDGKTPLHYRMIKPFDFDPSKKYPVLVYVYGGPHAQMVNNRWMGGASMWMYEMANRGFIVFTLDNRGSGHRSFEFESVIHRHLGDVEMEDQLAGVDFLKGLEYVDAERMAVHGWSYGGFMTTSLMLRKPGTFKVGVAGGPVTDWAYYEAMYGERYMDRPEENEEGYDKNKLMNYVSNLEGDLLLIHGTVDDVVVMQHNLALVKAFIDAEVQVDFFPYPMHPHNVRGKDRVHLMTKVLDYIEDNLK